MHASHWCLKSACIKVVIFHRMYMSCLSVHNLGAYGNWMTVSKFCTVICQYTK